MVGALAGVFAAAALLPAVAAGATTEFPSGYTAYHTYAETIAVLDTVVARHPSIVRKFTIGQSYQGRQLWAAKISDNVNVDESEPEVLITGLTHAREHITVEMAIYALRLLANNYGSDTRITRLVNTREIYIVFMLNPDGGEYDISGGDFHFWRKNRQPIPNSTQIGVDPNRNFGFRWGCCNGSSGEPSKETYRGPYPWYAPEVIAFRDFVRSRVIGGVQQIKVQVDFHSSGKYVLWPYSYTALAVPSTMTSDDHATFVALGKGAASRNGYTGQQSSKLYISDGTQGDWAYYEQRIFQLTIEMGPGGSVNFYPTGDRIGALTSVNRSAVLYLIGLADCPYRAAGLASSHCGTSVQALSIPTVARGRAAIAV